MEDRFLTPQNSADLVELLLTKHGWTLSRLARTVDAPLQFIRNVRAAKQSFEMRDLAALAQATGQNMHLLMFNSIPVGKLSSRERQLHDLTRREIERHQQFSRLMLRKPTRKKRTRTKAA
jgi:hypothetical protein